MQIAVYRAIFPAVLKLQRLAAARLPRASEEAGTEILLFHVQRLVAGRWCAAFPVDLRSRIPSSTAQKAASSAGQP